MAISQFFCSMIVNLFGPAGDKIMTKLTDIFINFKFKKSFKNILILKTKFAVST